MKIGIFDSGLAGLIVVRRLRDSLPFHDLIFLGDTAGFPYGIKSPSRVARCVEKGLDWLVDQGAAAIGIVCGSAAAVTAAGLVRLPALPLADTVTAAVPEALRASRAGRIGVLGSPATKETGVFRKLIEGAGSKVVEAAAPVLGVLVMAGWTRRPETRRIVKKALNPLKRQQIDTLIIASSAGLVLAGLIRAKIGTRVVVVDAGQALVGRMTADLCAALPAGTDALAGGSTECWLTDTADHFTAMAEKLYRGRIVVRQAPDL